MYSHNMQNDLRNCCVIHMPFGGGTRLGFPIQDEVMKHQWQTSGMLSLSGLPSSWFEMVRSLLWELEKP